MDKHIIEISNRQAQQLFNNLYVTHFFGFKYSLNCTNQKHYQICEQSLCIKTNV